MMKESTETDEPSSWKLETLDQELWKMNAFKIKNQMT